MAERSPERRQDIFRHAELWDKLFGGCLSTLSGFKTSISIPEKHQLNQDITESPQLFPVEPKPTSFKPMSSSDTPDVFLTRTQRDALRHRHAGAAANETKSVPKQLQPSSQSVGDQVQGLLKRVVSILHMTSKRKQKSIQFSYRGCHLLLRASQGLIH